MKIIVFILTFVNEIAIHTRALLHDFISLMPRVFIHFVIKVVCVCLTSRSVLLSGFLSPSISSSDIV